MIPVTDEKLKQVYDNTASLISKLYFKDVLCLEERDFLLNILDQIMISRNNFKFIELIKAWQASNYDSESNDLIKATLLNIDFNDKNALTVNTQIIEELLNYYKSSQ